MTRATPRWRWSSGGGSNGSRALLYGGTEEIGDVVYRFGYHTVARNGRWWWGQSALMLRESELEPLLAQARAEGTIT